jgi:hypothetical protein
LQDNFHWGLVTAIETVRGREVAALAENRATPTHQFVTTLLSDVKSRVLSLVADENCCRLVYQAKASLMRRRFLQLTDSKQKSADQSTSRHWWVELGS